MSTHWAINPAKQTVGRYLHEFLQREGEADGTIRQPLNSAIAALCSGQWYKEKSINHDSLIQAMSDYGSEFIGRGAPRLAVQILIARVLDAEMKMFGDQNKIKLEWWSLR